MILANVKPGAMLYTDGWRVGMFDDYSDKSYPFLSGKIDFNSIKILFFNFIVVKIIFCSKVNNRASNMLVGAHTDACLSEYGFQHKWINHALYYCDPDDKSLNTNRIEKRW